MLARATRLDIAGFDEDNHSTGTDPRERIYLFT